MYGTVTTHKVKGRNMRRTRTTGKPKEAYRTPKKVREYQKRYYQMHKAERAEYYMKNREKIIAYQQERYQTYRKEIRAYLKDYYKKKKNVKSKKPTQRLFLYQDKTGWKLHAEPVNGVKKKFPKAAQQGLVLAIEVIT
jgi:hypothetical protein